MKKILNVIVLSLTLGLLLTGCEENERMLYSAPSAVYFSEMTSEDSLQYSFASGLKEIDTVSIPLMIIGEKVSYPRQIQVEVDASTTAQENVHYKLSSTVIELPAGEVKTAVHVVVMDNDAALEYGSVALVLNLKANEDFVLGFPEQLSARLIITKQLVKPSYWEMPLSLYYGRYSKAKHRLCIQVQGFDFPETFDMDKVGDFISYGRMVYNSLLRNPLWDEETQTYIYADWEPL